ncbi:hypothetical protein pb186bvf_018403 [Paramecium bursaria]
MWGVSSFGRALDSHSRGGEIEALTLQKKLFFHFEMLEIHTFFFQHKNVRNLQKKQIKQNFYIFYIMGCIEFWAINSLLASALFTFYKKNKFILFLIIEGSPQFYKYPLTDHDGSVVALVLASMTYGVLGVMLLFWQMKRQQRIELARLYRAVN